MIHAYQETYLNKAQTTLGEAFDYAFNDCGISIKDLNSIIVNSEIISRFEQGDPAIIAGKSGPEIIIDIFYQAKNEYIKKTPEIKKFYLKKKPLIQRLFYGYNLSKLSTLSGVS